MSGKSIRGKRTTAGIAGDVLCKKLSRSRSWLCGVERGYISPTPEELTRIDTALDQLIQAKKYLQKAAAEVGWPVEAVV